MSETDISNQPGDGGREGDAGGRSGSRFVLGLYAALALAALVTVLLLPGFGIVVEFANTAAELVVP